MRTLSIQPGPQKNKANDIAETDGTEPPISESYLETPFDVLANSTSDWSWLDLGLNETKTLTSQYVPQSAYHPAVCPGISSGNRLLPVEATDGGLATSLRNCDFLEVQSDDVSSSLGFPFSSPLTEPPLFDFEFHPLTLASTVSHSQSGSKVQSHANQNQSFDTPASVIYCDVGNGQLPEPPRVCNSNDCMTTESKNHDLKYADSILSPDAKSSASSLVSINSLRKRLSLKYSDSYLGDVLSLMQNLTITRSSAISTKVGKRRFSKAMSGTFTSRCETVASLPDVIEMPGFDGEVEKSTKQLKREPSVVLPGVFPACCWGQINSSKLRQCSHGIGGRVLGPECRPPGRQLYRSIRSDIFSSILDGTNHSAFVDELDTFGNSVLHIAAACRSVNCLVRLLDLRAPVHVTNNAGQTFLHVVREPSATNHRDICSLLELLKERSFDFSQRDSHGQNALHSLTRPWIPKSTLLSIVNKLRSSGIKIPASRDALGWTVVQQLQIAGIEREDIQALLTSTNAPKIEMGSISIPNYEKDNSIETIEDLRLYTKHAELLRTIRLASDNPFFEDTHGRNGLHCLAEVSLDLPIPGKFPTPGTENTATPAKPRRQHYLENLLKAGVDPNNFDKQGSTPLMAFVTHEPAGDEDDENMRILSRLLSAGAEIDYRNRNGETTLHIAVKLGRREATKFLLGHGANVHARNSGGLGVVAVGEAASKRAIHDEVLYAQIMLCISLVASAGGVSAPTILQEWASPQWKIHYNG